MATTVETASLSDLELVSKLETLYSNARMRKTRHYEEWRRNYLLVNNKMWSEARTANWMPSPTSSEIFPIISSLIAWMTDQAVIFSCSAAADPHTLYADWLNKLSNDLENILQSNWLNNNLDDEIYLSCWDAALYGCGILKTVWDSGLHDGLGDAVFRRISPWSFYPDPNSSSMKDAQYFVEVQRLSFEEVQRRFPLAYDEIIANEASLAQGPGTDFDSPPSLYDADQYPKTNPGQLPQSGSYPKSNFGASAPGTFGRPGQGRRTRAAVSDGVIVHEFWIRENRVEPLDESPVKEPPNPNYAYPDPVVYDEWRVVVVCSGVILMDEHAKDLWGTGRHPYTRYCFDDVGEFWGVSLVSHLAPAQIAINRLLGAMQSNAELIGNPIFMEPDDSGISRTAIINRPGQRLRLKGGPNASPNQPSWLNPPNMPQFIGDLIQFWIQRMENISGLSSVTKGQPPPARTPSASVAASQESGFVRVRQAMRNLEDCLRTAGELIAELITENYTTPRVVAIVGPEGEQASLQLSARHFYGTSDEGSLPFRFSIFIDAGANNPTSRQSRIAEADTLFAMGAIDRLAVLQTHNYPGAQLINQRMEQKEQQQALAHQQSQRGPGKRVSAGRNT